jgi:ATP-dependent DNA helicase RecQ
MNALPPPSHQDLLTALHHHFGHESFQPGQEDCIRALLAGLDVLTVLPTSGGKSLVYQLAAQLLPGITIVVSPLIALMKDQVDSLASQGVDVGVLHSQQTARESEAELDDVHHHAKLLYVTPERFEDDAFLAEIRDLQVSLLAVDEAHTLVEWGHDFRPSYLKLAAVARELGRPTLLALTATATPWAQRAIAERLGMREPKVVVRGTDRPNLFFEVATVASADQKWARLERLLAGELDDATAPDVAETLSSCMGGSGIIYTGTTRRAEEIVEWLQAHDIPSDFYHGRRRKADREAVQDAFMAGDLRVIAATNAFGLGVDKPDVRFVIHFDAPSSVEEYFQEAGRAGRDALPARCVLLYHDADLARAAFRSAGTRLTVDDFDRIREALRKPGVRTIAELRATAELSEGRAVRAILALESCGVLALKGHGFQLLQATFDPEAISLDTEERANQYERSRRDMLRTYAELRDCRRRFLLNYLGEDLESPTCGWCDYDLAPREPSTPEADPVESTPFLVGDLVRHRTWGEGTVHRTTGDTVTILFDAMGYHTFDATLVVAEGVIEPLSNAITDERVSIQLTRACQGGHDGCSD